MSIYYVATLARYALVDAEDETQARERGRIALFEQYADVRQRLGSDALIEIRTVRLVTFDEIELSTWDPTWLRGSNR